MKKKLFEFAYCGLFYKKIEYLSTICEKENWYYDAPEVKEEEKKLAVLYQYIHNIFEKHLLNNSIIKKEDWAIINTGLLTLNGEDIYMLFNKNTNLHSKLEFYFKSFYVRSSREIPSILKPVLPEPIDFFKDNPEKMYFKTDMNIIPNFNHIYDDNKNRLPKLLQEIDRESALNILSGSLQKAIKKAKRNNRIVIPQFFHGNIQYLLPLVIFEQTVPLVLEIQENEYRANTILTIGMAYNNARLIMKPESSWLII